MIEVDRLTKIYGETRSLDGLSFGVGPGEVLGFLGPNGAGKTTTMRVLTGLIRPDGGTARVCGHDVVRDHRRVRAAIGFLPEDSPHYPEMRVEAFLRFMADMKLVPRGRVRSEVDRVIEETDLGGWRKRLVGNISKGTRQRLGVAQALLGDPEVLILDEPTVGLDPNQIGELRSLIAGMRGRRTVIFSTHILSNVSACCTHVVIIDRGRSIASGPIDQLGRDCGERSLHVEVGGDGERAADVIRRTLEGMSPRIAARAEGTGTVFDVVFQRSADPRPALAKALVGAGVELRELRERGASLEDVFVRATTAPHPPGRQESP